MRWRLADSSSTPGGSTLLPPTGQSDRTTLPLCVELPSTLLSSIALVRFLPALVRPNRPQQLVIHHPTFPVQPRPIGLVRLDSSPSRRSPHACRGAPVMGPLPHPTFQGILYSHEEPVIPECTHVFSFNRLLSSFLSRSLAVFPRNCSHPPTVHLRGEAFAEMFAPAFEELITPSFATTFLPCFSTFAIAIGT